MTAFTAFFLMFVLFQVKHWLCDYPLQRPWMLAKYKPWPHWVAPLAAHAGVHAVFTLGLTFGLTSLFLYGAPSEFTGLFFGVALQLAIIDFLVHFAMDFVKASPKLLGRWKALSKSEFMAATQALKVPLLAPDARRALRSNRLYWYVLGFDQMVHHITHYYILVAMFKFWAAVAALGL